MERQKDRGPAAGREGVGMTIQKFTFTLKDGRKAVVRSPREEDVPELLSYLSRSSAETEFLLRYPEECGKYTPEKEKQLIENWNASDCDAMLVCLVDGRLAGNCHVSWNNSIKTGHRASVAIALLQAYWGLGIGTRLMEEMIRIARQNERILQVELEFVEGNARARALYEKAGFRIAGVHPDAIRLKDGTLLNEYTMIKKIR